MSATDEGFDGQAFGGSPRPKDEYRSQKITAATVAAAVRDAAAGERYLINDTKAEGLQLRVRGRNAVWSLRARWRGKQARFALGSPPGVSIDDARNRVADARALIRTGQDPTAKITEWTTGVPEYRQEERGIGWPWEHARDEFLGWVQEYRRPRTHDSYRSILILNDMSVLAGKRVDRITREDVAQILSGIHRRGAEAQAEAACRTLSAMWTWMSESSRVRETGVAPNTLSKLKPPERRRLERGQGAEREAEDADVPPALEVGRLLAICRSGALEPWLSCGLMLLLGTAQRALTVSSARHCDLFADTDHPTNMQWNIPPARMKSGRRRRSRRDHIVPLVGWVADAVVVVQKTPVDSKTTPEESLGFLFPAGRQRRAGEPTRVPHIGYDVWSDWLSRLPGINFSAHALRRAFGSHGSRVFGWDPDTDVALILDHQEGVKSSKNSMTKGSYVLDPDLAKKTEMLTEWVGLLDQWCAQAVEKDPWLADAERVRGRILPRVDSKPKKCNN